MPADAPELAVPPCPAELPPIPMPAPPAIHRSENANAQLAPCPAAPALGLSLSLDDLRALPARTQITRHDCVEGWSVIGKWTGVQLSHVLKLAQPAKQARYVVFRCYDTMDDGSEYYESLGFDDAYHPQTLLAWELNGKTLPIANGAPLRLRVPRQLGYKMAKFLRRIDLVASFKDIEGGRGGYWEDQGYQWYAGI